MDSSIKNTITKYALQNAIKFNGKASPGAVIGKVLGENPEMKEKASELMKDIAKIVSETNKLGLEKQEKKLKELAPELLKKREKTEEKDIFEFLNIREGQKVVTAFPPEPSKYPHIGHAKALIMNYELAKRHSGKLILRFEDTNPELVQEEFYKIHLDNYKWLGIMPDKIDYASDFMKEMYTHAEKMIKANNAYVCSCRQEQIKKNRRAGEECDHRHEQPEKNLELWKEMFETKEGKYVLRLKGRMKSPNSALRDPIIFRVIDKTHPRQKKKYRIWPTYDFENAIMDGIEGVTHRLRTKEFELRNELQRLLQTMAGFKETEIYEFARFNLEGVESSGRIIREKIRKKQLIGWDDPSLTTLAALKRRGFLPESIKEFILSTGLTKNEALLTWDDLVVHNRRHLDAKCNRYFFIDSPKEIKIENAPTQNIELKIHPDFEGRGKRKFTTHGQFYVSEKDFNGFKDGKLIRLMDCLNFRKAKGKFVFDSKDYKLYKNHGGKIIHWLPVEKGLVKVEVLMPDRKIGKGLAEPMVKNLKIGDIIQFARFGFCKLDSREKDKLKFWYTHG